ncbi:11628_t:CDS:2 [Entrophospora sp. SA101]|nr:11628_t:CDS:2 [Entrophospora sp. SA101]
MNASTVNNNNNGDSQNSFNGKEKRFSRINPRIKLFKPNQFGYSSIIRNPHAKLNQSSEKNKTHKDVDLDTRSSNQLKHGLSVDELEPVQSYKRRQFTVPNSQFRTTDSRTISRSTIFTNPYSRELRHAVKNIEEMQTFENSLLSIDIDGCLKENYHDITTSQTKNDTMLGSTNNTNNTISSDLILTFMALDDISKIESESFIKKKNVETNIVNDNNGGNIDAVSSDGSNSHNDVERIEVGYDDLSGIAQIMNNNFASTQSIQTSSDIQNQMEVLLNRGIFQSFESNDDVDNSHDVAVIVEDDNDNDNNYNYDYNTEAKKWLKSYIKEINVINGIAPKIISNRGYAYKRAYKNAIKTAQAISYQKIGDTYEIFYGDWLNFEDFK